MAGTSAHGTTRTGAALLANVTAERSLVAALPKVTKAWCSVSPTSAECGSGESEKAAVACPAPLNRPNAFSISGFVRRTELCR